MGNLYNEAEIKLRASLDKLKDTIVNSVGENVAATASISHSIDKLTDSVNELIATLKKIHPEIDNESEG